MKLWKLEPADRSVLTVSIVSITTILMLASGLLVGCRRAPVERAAEQIKLAELPGLSTTHHRPLQNEYDRLVQEKATPLQLDEEAEARRERQRAAAAPVADDARDGGVADAEPAKGRATDPTVLSEIFPASTLSSGRDKSDRMFPESGMTMTPSHRQQVETHRTVHRRQTTLYRQFLRGPAPDVGLRHRLGLLADYNFVDSMRVGNRLLAFDAVSKLNQGLVDQAIGDLELMFRAVEIVGAEKQLVPRVASVWMRLEAFQVLEAIAREPAAASELHKLFALVEDQLAYWPLDADTWIGERAQALHTFELIRAGDFESILTPEELAELQDSSRLASVGSAVTKWVDRDEFFYLSFMRRIIASCQKPFYQRRAALAEVRKKLVDLAGEPDYPYVTDQILLSGFEQGHSLLAQDRDVCEAWAAALATAAAIPGATTKRISVFSGEPIPVRPLGTYVQVDGLRVGDREIVIMVPFAK